MKYITKSQEPLIFIEWKNQRNDSWTPMYHNLQGVEKQAVLISLKEEQGYICCYCERRLEAGDCHIEHLKPQSENLYPENQLDYDNLICSCQGELDRGEPRHCGNSKEDWYNEQLLISPLSVDCEEKFKYTYDGYIESAIETDIAANTTINKLQLKIDKLNALRKKAIEPFIDDELTQADLNNFVAGYLVDKNQNEGRFNEFFTTIQYLFSA